ncbi:MAG: polysaccharide biosynthesis/export family protein [Sphingomonas sp.]
MKLSSAVIAAALALTVAGCATDPLPAGPAPQATAYTLGAGDKVRITTFGFENLSGEFTVGADNAVELPLVGSIPVKGLTPSELQARIASTLEERKIVVNPRVSAEVIEYRPYYILGEVSKPGQYPFTNGLTVLKAVATAQGFTYRANERTIFITRDDTNQEMMVPLTPSTPVRPGDTVRIAERRL